MLITRGICKQLTALVAAGASLALAAPTASVAAASAGCSLSSTGGTITRTLDGRTYRLNVPAGLTGAAVPLLVSLHGNYEPVSTHESSTGWSAFAAARGFIVAYPQGTGQFTQWNIAQGSSDVEFLENVVADISATWCVDARHVHATGFSNGAQMSERLACDAADVFASVAAHTGSSPAIQGSPCVPGRPIAVGIFSGIFDPISSYPINVVNRDEWVARNGCSTTPAMETGVLVEASRYASCDGGVEVTWRVYTQSHNWPIGGELADIQRRMWALFQSNPKP